VSMQHPSLTWKATKCKAQIQPENGALVAW